MKKIVFNISEFAGKCWRKFKEFCKWLSKKAGEVKDFLMDEENAKAIQFIVTTLSFASIIVKHFTKAPTYKNEMAYQQRNIYDSSLGYYCPLRKKLSPDQLTEIAMRKRDGEPMGQILESMRVLL